MAVGGISGKKEDPVWVGGQELGFGGGGTKWGSRKGSAHRSLKANIVYEENKRKRTRVEPKRPAIK